MDVWSLRVAPKPGYEKPMAIELTNHRTNPIYGIVTKTISVSHRDRRVLLSGMVPRRGPDKSDGIRFGRAKRARTAKAMDGLRQPSRGVEVQSHKRGKLQLQVNFLFLLYGAEERT